MQAISVEALIVIDVHAMEVVDQLIQEQVNDVNAFEWISQLRYYMQIVDGQEDCYVRCIQTNFPYGYEYLGNTTRLVITPLTDKCYMTLMGAIRLNLGGAPAGPAGTGKTETTKDLSKAVAKQCVVFNCQESMDYKFVAKFFKGLACSGAWCCFDEFNRINIEVLSVIAQQLQELFQAKAEGIRELTFDDTAIKMEPTFSVFITMNPGYAGRTELPQNLKALFRPVAMMVPDYALIGQIKLFSFGFIQAKELAKKMVATFRLASELLSNQKHYDYGMRAVSSVINAAGLFRKQLDENFSEEQILLKALKDVNMPKFLQQDLPLFENIIRDLFPTVNEMKEMKDNLQTALLKSCKALNLQPQGEFLLKINQLYDTIQVRHGLMLVGDTLGGKTSCYRTLQHSLNQLSLHDSNIKKVKVEIINPKALSLFELYGVSKDVSWDEGVIEIVMERAIKSEENCRHWILFDGPVDAVWIESMNTVLDDNKKLCLSSGKVLLLSQEITMMFEVENLLEASPATVSRCGMIYMEPSNLHSKNLITSFSNCLDDFYNKPNYILEFNRLVNEIFYPALTYWQSLNQAIFENSENSVVAGFLRLFECFQSSLKSPNEKQLETFINKLPFVFVFTILWSVGVNLPNKQREQFSQFLQSLQTNLPEGNLFDYKYDVQDDKWIDWENEFKDFSIPLNSQFHEILIPTKDFIRGMNISKLLLSNHKHVMTPGPVGSGKTSNALKTLSEYLDSNLFTSIQMTFSAQTKANQIIDTVFATIDKRKKGVYGPANGKKCILFVDELNMPMKEVYGAQPPLELLRQYLDHSHWYVMKLNKEYINIEDIIILGCLVPPGSGRNTITSRLSRHFNVVPYTELDGSTAQKIFTQILDYFYSGYNQDIKRKISSIVQASVSVYEEVKRTLLPTPSKSHYLFNLRDLSRQIQGMCLAQPKYLKTLDDIYRLWWHENRRVFEDRLVSEEDKERIEILLEREMGIHFKKVFKDLQGSEELIFTTLMNEQSRGEGYAQVESIEQFQEQIERYLWEYNQEVSAKKQMNLVMFKNACFYVA